MFLASSSTARTSFAAPVLSPTSPLHRWPGNETDEPATESATARADCVVAEDKSVLEAYTRDRAEKLSEQRKEDYRRDPSAAELLKKLRRPEDPLDIKNEAEVLAAVIKELLKPALLTMQELGAELSYWPQCTTEGTRPDITVSWNSRPVFQIEVKGLAVVNNAMGAVYEDALDPTGKVGLR